VDPKTVAQSQLFDAFGYIAHEFAHQWFGDLVTMDCGMTLAERSLCRMDGDKISDEVNPQYSRGVTDLRLTQEPCPRTPALHARHPPSRERDGQLLEAADELAYQKGQAVLGMFEQWLGPETRAGVNAYLKEHEWGNAVGEDLWSALSKASGKDASSAMKTSWIRGACRW